MGWAGGPKAWKDDVWYLCSVYFFPINWLSDLEWGTDMWACLPHLAGTKVLTAKLLTHLLLGAEWNLVLAELGRQWWEGGRAAWWWDD